MSKKNRNEPEDAKPKASQEPVRWRDYLWANAVFFGFLLLLTFIVWQSSTSPTDDQHIRNVLSQSFKFMIFLFGGGFLVVTLFDMAYDFFAAQASDQAPPAEAAATEKDETPVQNP